MSAKAIQGRMNTLKILWGALTGAIPLYALVLFFMAQNEQRPPPPESNVMVIALGAVALSTAVMSQLMPMKMYRDALSRRKFKTTEERFGDASPGQYRQPVDTHKVFADPKGALSTGLLLYNTPFILGMALTESVALFGLVLGFLGYPIMVVAPFFGVALALALLRFPSVTTVIKALEKAVGARMPD